ncbi:hypothetical protein BA062_23200 [Prauserella flavalba]|uniref:Esterase-like activity of phytase family protein n=1 Tax=Prauserella flavalba TaxID=1477506 RepID=A0A318LV57_9PSEU|nr:hypothetical protein BA062_23200 [Prauserella flavalba]
MLALLLAAGAVPASAQAPAPDTVCSLGDERLAEVSGLAADDGSWYAVNDGGTSIEIFVLGKDCSVQDVLTDPTDPYDVEDLALAPDGTLWLGDTGDNRKRRDTVALHAVPPGGQATLYRLTYPDGAHDAEALLLDRAGTPYLITKNVLGGSAVYRPSAPLASPGPTPLEKVGSLSLSATDTPGGPVGTAGSMLVTGAATNADGSVFAVRTYTDAYLYPAPDGDVVAALQRSPVRVPLPDEAQGEAIAFEPDGSLLSVSEGAGSPVRVVRGAAGLVDVETAPSEPAGGPEEAAGSPAPAAEQDSSGVPVLPGIAIAVGVAAVLVFGLSRLRRR